MINRKTYPDGEVVYSFNETNLVRVRNNEGVIKFMNIIDGQFKNTFVIQKEILISMFNEAKLLMKELNSHGNKKK